MLKISNDEAAHVGYCYYSASTYLGNLATKLSDVRESDEAREAREQRNTRAHEEGTKRSSENPSETVVTVIEGEWDPSTLEFYSRKVVGSLCFAGLIVVATVEHLARLIIVLVVALPALANDGWSEKVGLYASVSVTHLIDHPLRFAKGIVQNIRGVNCSFQDLTLCDGVMLAEYLLEIENDDENDGGAAVNHSVHDRDGTLHTTTTTTSGGEAEHHSDREGEGETQEL